MSEKHHIIPVWFFVGILLLTYGVLIFISGLTEWSTPPANVALSEYHAPVWWGALLIVLGGVYTLMFRPGKKEN
jgi:FtsH-binding integral membrane protein